jgi:hypothetical protein
VERNQELSDLMGEAIMNMTSEYLRNFFEGPFTSKKAAIMGAARLHGEKSLVVGEFDGGWWSRPWAEENFRFGHWPEGFESVSRFDVGLAITPRLRVRHFCDTDFSLEFLVAANMSFANWMKGERAAPIGSSRYDFRHGSARTTGGHP